MDHIAHGTAGRRPSFVTPAPYDSPVITPSDSSTDAGSTPATPSPQPAISSADVHELGADRAEDFCALMQAAFAEYRDKDAPSGALLETPASLREECAGGTRLLGIERDGQLVAGMKITRSRTRTLEMARLGVLPQRRGQGLPRALVEAAAELGRREGLRAIGCTVRADETDLIAMYEHLGLTAVAEGVHQSLTGRVLPVVTMRLRLEPAAPRDRGPALADVLGDGATGSAR